MDLFYELEQKLNEYMGVGVQGILFVCAVLFFALKKEKSPQMRMYITYVCVLFVVMINPLSMYVIDKMGHVEVYERILWLFMSTFLVALTFVVLLQKKKRFLVPCLLLLLLGGQSVFTDVEYEKAQNIEKINQEAIEVCDMIMRDFEGLDAEAEVIPNRFGIESPRAVVTEPLNEDVRMYNANIELWYVRKNFGSFQWKNYNELSQNFTRDNSGISVDILIKYMKKQNFEYIVIGDWQELTGDMSQYNIRLVGQTEHYRVYRYTADEN